MFVKSSLSTYVLGLLLLHMFFALLSTRLTSSKCHFQKHRIGLRFSSYQPKFKFVNKRLNTSNETSCEDICCLSSRNCSVYMFFSNLSLLNDSISNCFLLSCHESNKSLCINASQYEPNHQSTGSIFVGFKDTVNNTDTSSSTHTNKQLKQFNHSSFISISQHHHFYNKTTNTSIDPITLNSSSVIPQQLLSLNKSTEITFSKVSQQSQMINNSNVNSSTSYQLHPSDKTLNLSFHKLNETLKINSENNKLPNLTSNLDSLSNQTTNNNKIYTSQAQSPESQPLSTHNPLALLSGTMQSQITHHSSIQAEHSPSNGAFITGNILVLGSLKSKSTHKKLPVSSQVLKDVNKSPSPKPSTTQPKSRKKFSESHSHTTPVSLVIALMIGILFFCAVVFLIGRRWLETCCRRSYSHVDYLLNDYD